MAEPPPRPRRRRRHPLLAIVLLVLVIVAATHAVAAVTVPWLWVGFFAVILLFATGTIGHSHSHSTPTPTRTASALRQVLVSVPLTERRSWMYRRDGAHHAVAETGRADAEGQVEAAAHVLQRDVVRQFHELAVVEMLAKPVE